MLIKVVYYNNVNNNRENHEQRTQCTFHGDIIFRKKIVRQIVPYFLI